METTGVCRPCELFSTAKIGIVFLVCKDFVEKLICLQFLLYEIYENMYFMACFAQQK